jgi:hypothetical protein
VKPYTVASVRIIGAFSEDEIHVATPKRVPTIRWLNRSPPP